MNPAGVPRSNFKSFILKVDKHASPIAKSGIFNSRNERILKLFIDRTYTRDIDDDSNVPSERD